MGFPVNNVTSASGFATLPLSRVDIILTVRRGNDKDSKTKIILTNILVLAADLDITRDKGMAAPPGGDLRPQTRRTPENQDG